MKEPHCPVCGGEVDPQRLADICRQEQVDGMLILETSYNLKPVQEELSRQIEEMSDAQVGLRVLRSGVRRVNLLALGLVGIAVGSLFAQEWAVSILSGSGAIIHFITAYRVKTLASDAISRFERNMKVVESANRVDPDQVSNN
jgi:hypothetical protein